MKNNQLKFGWAAAVGALFGCGETGSEPPPARPAGGGLTIELPEPKAPPAPVPLPVPVPVPEPKSEDPEPEETKVEKAPPPVNKPIAETPQQEAPSVRTPAPEAASGSEPQRASEAALPLPLPATVIARTIERIGYSCGAIAASSRISAPAGETAYRIVCTSGDTYRASDSSGRFRFRKWSESGQ